MKSISILLVTAMVVIAIEKSVSKYLLVEVDGPEQRGSSITCPFKKISCESGQDCPPGNYCEPSRNICFMRCVPKESFCELNPGSKGCERVTAESRPAPKLMCDQEKGNSALQIVGTVLKIEEMKDCESSASYVIKQHGMTKPEICDSLVDNLLGKLPGDDSAKQFIRGQYDDFGVDKETTKVSDLCKCTCQKDVDNAGRLETKDGPEDPLTCCKKHGVSENCLGLCTKVESRGLSNHTSFTSACDQHKLSIMRCIVASFEDKPMKDDKKSRFGCVPDGSECTTFKDCCRLNCLQGRCFELP